MTYRFCEGQRPGKEVRSVLLDCGNRENGDDALCSENGELLRVHVLPIALRHLSRCRCFLLGAEKRCFPKGDEATKDQGQNLVSGLLLQTYFLLD